jgi:hypothetical protein
MVNGVAWAKDDIELLVEASETDGWLKELAMQLNRSPEAVFGKARKLNLPVRSPTQAGETT